ncbi:Hsp70 family protein [Sulfitobacter sp. JB4-11]|uniref:Hsp70 family protein n=1 Tax=Sulfitobacter rhodophyticola TaxID=3238304 RepID=UPI003515A35C
MGQVLGIDFGTSNSAVGVSVNGRPHLIEMEPGQQTLPTAVFFDFEDQQVIYGTAAQQALIHGDEGRYMRALKSLLGTGLMRESRMLLGKRTDFIEIVGMFLAELKSRAEEATGQVFDRALSGRPVLFHSGDERRNAQALIDLKACYASAGFSDVRFLPEPEAAALAAREALSPGDLGLVVDIGGGTSDFTLFRQKGLKEIEILRSNGLRLGGTDFDKEISLSHVMPHLGRGTPIRHEFGDQTHIAPNKIFADLATWQKIPFLYAADTRRAAQDLVRNAVEVRRLQRLVTVLEDELGHDLAFAVEAGKMTANDPSALAPPQINLDFLEKDTRLPLPAAMMAATLAEGAERIGQAAAETVTQAGLSRDDVTTLVFVGGSSLMSVVGDAIGRQFPTAKIHRTSALTGVVDGLALAAEQAFR